MDFKIELFLCFLIFIFILNKCNKKGMLFFSYRYFYNNMFGKVNN